ncbi:hypothetical protein F4802DRAFT_5722 [Xylaria palmicola]|nr:hypothetical protein F4802DRAFT_5722 [Xylaria palmicola]
MSNETLLHVLFSRTSDCQAHGPVAVENANHQSTPSIDLIAAPGKRDSISSHRRRSIRSCDMASHDSSSPRSPELLDKDSPSAPVQRSLSPNIRTPGHADNTLPKTQSTLIYSPLDPAAGEIRVLSLLPGRFAQPIQCTLQITSENNSKYEALSYVWGDATDRRGIIVDGQDLDVTVSLENALRHLRHQRQPRHLWVDAICIDQENVKEKSILVPRMGIIYTNASRVLVWLGTPSPAMSVACSWAIKHSGMLGYLHRLRCKILSSLSYATCQRISVELVKILVGFIEISSHPYWTRMWTFQEYKVAREEPLIVCGHFAFPTSLTSTAKDSAYSIFRKVLERVVKTKPKDERGRHRRQILVDQLRQLANGTRWTAVMGMSLRTGPENAEPLLGRLLTSTSRRVCGDPRDHVYALYGMVPRAQDVYPADYSKTVQQVMHDTTLYLVRHEGSLEVSVFFCLSEDRLRPSASPSWILDLTQDVQTSKSPNQYRCARFCAKDLTQKFRYLPLETSSNGMILYLPTQPLGQCQVLHRFSNNAADFIRELIDLLSSASSGTDAFRDSRWSAVIESAGPHGLGNKLVAATTAHIFSSNLTSAEVFITYLQSLDENHLEDDAVGEEATDYITAGQILQLRGKTLFTVMGRLGVSVSGVEDGDDVVVARGFLQPLVLRHESEDSLIADQRPNVRLAGFAYVDGIMNNDSKDTELILEIAERETRTYAVN